MIECIGMEPSELVMPRSVHEQEEVDAQIERYLAEGERGFSLQFSSGIWGAAFTAALELLEEEADEPRRMEVLHLLGRRLVETWRREGSTTITGMVAHLHLLEAASLADRHGSPNPTAWLAIFQDLVRLERWMAEASRKEPPGFGIYFTLAFSHSRLAAKLAEEWGEPLSADDLVVGERLLRQSRNWSDSSRLKWFWKRLRRKMHFQPLSGVQLLGLGTVLGEEIFLEEHFDAVWDVLAASITAQIELSQFLEELCEMGQYADKVGASVIDSWKEMIEDVLR